MISRRAAHQKPDPRATASTGERRALTRRRCSPPAQEVIDIIETVYRGARKGRGLVVSPKDYSTKYRY